MDWLDEAAWWVGSNPYHLILFVSVLALLMVAFWPFEGPRSHS